jgi:hypothetical protein
MKRSNSNRQSLYVTAARSFYRGLAGRVVAFIERIVPIGYEDETGFHIRA